MRRSLLGRGGAAIVAGVNRCLRWSSLPPELRSQPNPARSYAAARARAQALERAEPATLNGKCRYRSLLHPAATPTAVVFLHGFTNCPQQFHALGQRLFARGYNVLLPRLPYHGMADRLSPEQGRLTAAELVASVEAAIDIAQGLGQRVVVAGISAGAVAAAWAAQQRHDIAHALLIAPALGYASAPSLLAETITLLALRLPNMFVWWDRATKERIPGPTHAYPRFSTRAVGQVFWLGRAVLEAASHAPPPTAALTLVTSAADLAVNRGLIDELACRWQRQGATVRHHDFPATQGVVHDMVDPDQPGQQIDLVYPVLLDLITNY